MGAHTLKASIVKGGPPLKKVSNCNIHGVLFFETLEKQQCKQSDLVLLALYGQMKVPKYYLENRVVGEPCKQRTACILQFETFLRGGPLLLLMLLRCGHPLLLLMHAFPPLYSINQMTRDDSLPLEQSCEVFTSDIKISGAVSRTN